MGGNGSSQKADMSFLVLTTYGSKEMVVAFECGFRPRVRQEGKVIQALFSLLISEEAELGRRGEMGGVSCPLRARELEEEGLRQVNATGRPI